MFVCPSQKTLAYYEIGPFLVNYEFIMLCITGPEATKLFMVVIDEFS